MCVYVCVCFPYLCKMLYCMRTANKDSDSDSMCCFSLRQRLQSLAPGVKALPLSKSHFSQSTLSLVLQLPDVLAQCCGVLVVWVLKAVFVSIESSSECIFYVQCMFPPYYCLRFSRWLW